MRRLADRLGPDPRTWAWGRVHRRQITSLLGIASLGYGPLASDGGRYTPNAAPGDVPNHGPSWRFVVDLGDDSAVGVYPGGQSENPASAWYDNRVSTWWTGGYEPMFDMERARSLPGSATWTLRP